MIFGVQRNKDILTNFLQTVTELSDDECNSITIMNPHLGLDNLDDKQGILDIKATAKSGAIIDIEAMSSSIRLPFN